MIRVIVCGANGKMGREVLKAVYQDPSLHLVGAVDHYAVGTDIGQLMGVGTFGIEVGGDLATAIQETKPHVMVDFTNPQSVKQDILAAAKLGVHSVVGTTGLSERDLQEIRGACQANGVNVFIAPNFSIGAVLMMKLSQEAAKYMPYAEIIELHHDQKLDAPSGTALRTADLIAKQRGYLHQGHPDEKEILAGARGGEYEGIRLHSVRLPGYVAHQEVIFGGLGQTLTIRHDSISRESFMPGVVLACKKVQSVNGLVVGLENIMD